MLVQLVAIISAHDDTSTTGSYCHAKVIVGQDFVGLDIGPLSNVSGNTIDALDAACCSLCQQNYQCQYWVRDNLATSGSSYCWLKNNFTNMVAATTRRGAFAGELAPIALNPGFHTVPWAYNFPVSVENTPVGPDAMVCKKVYTTTCLGEITNTDCVANQGTWMDSQNKPYKHACDAPNTSSFPNKQPYPCILNSYGGQNNANVKDQCSGTFYWAAKSKSVKYSDYVSFSTPQICSADKVWNFYAPQCNADSTCYNKCLSSCVYSAGTNPTAAPPVAGDSTCYTPWPETPDPGAMAITPFVETYYNNSFSNTCPGLTGSDACTLNAAPTGAEDCADTCCVPAAQVYDTQAVNDLCPQGAASGRKLHVPYDYASSVCMYWNTPVAPYTKTSSGLYKSGTLMYSPSIVCNMCCYNSPYGFNCQDSITNATLASCNDIAPTGFAIREPPPPPTPAPTPVPPTPVPTPPTPSPTPPPPACAKPCDASSGCTYCALPPCSYILPANNYCSNQQGQGYHCCYPLTSGLLGDSAPVPAPVPATSSDSTEGTAAGVYFGLAIVSVLLAVFVDRRNIQNQWKQVSSK